MVLLAQTPKNNKPKKLAVRVIIKSPCLGRRTNRAQMEHLDFGLEADFEEDDARELVVQCGRGWYMHPIDDPTSEKDYTITPERKSAIDCELRMRAERDVEKSEDQLIKRVARRELLQEQAKVV
jgi:hypothetical protein